MRYLFLIIAGLNLAACGLSEKERQETAIITCNILAESRNMDAAVRIKEINSARDELGEEKFLQTDETIGESVKWGLCKELVLGDALYDEKLAEKRTAYAAREAEQEEKLAAVLVAKLGAEKDLISKQLSEAKVLISEMRQQISDLTLGGEIDNQANEEVRQTIESLQEVNAELNEEVSFYKGVMAPNFAKKGLRIEKTGG